MNLLILILIVIPLFSSPSSAQPRPLPEVIGVMSGQGFGADFCCVGDQNDDGYDDLLISNEGINRAEMYFGGEEMGAEPGFVFEPWLLDQSIRADLNLVDHLELPESHEVSLRANPNPFNSELSIRYALSKSGKVKLSTYDINGREINIIENRYVKKGNRELSWSFGTAGVYFVVLKTDYVQKAVKVVCIP